MSVLLFLSISIFGFAQEMKPEAGKLYNEGNSHVERMEMYNGAISKYDAALAD
ncbi:MAG: hypothetical protein MZV64_48905 [Ignavibacteriales bacterium]|nr:hypothetical protein [Ignavibacteriales bacterium]